MSMPSKPGPTNSPPGARGRAQAAAPARDVSLDAIEGAGLLTKAHGARQDAAAVIVRQCEDYLQTGDVAPLLATELGEAMAESQSRPDLTRSPNFPLIVDRDRARFGAWYQMMPRSQSQSRRPARHAPRLHRARARYRRDGL